MGKPYDISRENLLSDRTSLVHVYLMFVVYRTKGWLPIWNSQNCSMFSLAFVAGSLQGNWWGFISRNYVVWPIFFLMNVFIALKGTHFWILFRYNLINLCVCACVSEHVLFAVLQCIFISYYICRQQISWWIKQNLFSEYLYYFHFYCALNICMSFWAGLCGIWLYQFLIISYFFTLPSFSEHQ